MTELDRTWKNCLRMWEWIARVWDGTVHVIALKQQWLNKHKFTKTVSGNCFFCQYVVDKGNACNDCPGTLVDEYFDCSDEKYHHMSNPVAFYAEILRLDAIRTKGK